MTIVELANTLAEQKSLTKVAAREYVDLVLDTIKSSVADGPVQLRGFGTFKMAHREARECINPQNPTGPKVQVPARDVMTFKASKGE